MQNGDEGFTEDFPPAKSPKAKKYTPDAIVIPSTHQS